MRSFFFVALAAAAIAIGCGPVAGGGDDATGFACSTTGGTVVFDSDNCRERIASSTCRDGGPETRTNADGGNARLCCAYEGCYKDPFPEYH